MSLNSDSRTKNSTRNAITSFTNKLIILFITFFSRKIFIKYIGVEYLGINGLFANVLTLLSMADLGLGTAMNVSLYKPIAEKDTDKICALLNYFRKLYYFIALAVFFIGLSLTPFLSYIVNTPNEIPHLEIYFLIFVINNVVSYLFVYKSSIIKADQRSYIVNRVDVWVNIIKIIIKIIIVIIFKNYLLYILLDVIGTFTHNIIVTVIANKYYPFIKGKAILNTEERKLIFTDISSVFIYKISWSLLNGTDNILISVICGTVFVGIYSNYHTITNTLTQFVALLFNSLTASIGNLVVKETPEKRYEIFKIMEMTSYWLCGIITVCLFYLTQDFIELWFGKELLLNNITLLAIICNVLFSLCMRPVWSFREGTGMYKQIRYIMFITAIVNLILSIFLGRILGLAGIFFATVISKISTYFLYEPIILYKNFFRTSAYRYYLNFISNILIIIITILICYFPIRFFKNITIINWFLKAFICFFIVNIIFFLRYHRTNEFIYLRMKILTKMKKNI